MSGALLRILPRCCDLQWKRATTVLVVLGTAGRFYAVLSAFLAPLPRLAASGFPRRPVLNRHGRSRARMRSPVKRAMTVSSVF